MKSINNIMISESTLRTVNALAAKRNITPDEMIAKIIEDGAANLVYRANRNAQKWAETKSLKSQAEYLRSKLQEAGVEFEEGEV